MLHRRAANPPGTSGDGLQTPNGHHKVINVASGVGTGCGAEDGTACTSCADETKKLHGKRSRSSGVCHVGTRSKALFPIATTLLFVVRQYAPSLDEIRSPRTGSTTSTSSRSAITHSTRKTGTRYEQMAALPSNIEDLTTRAQGLSTSTAERRQFSNAPHQFIQISPTFSYLPRRTILADQPRGTADRRTALSNKESILMSKKFRKRLEGSHSRDYRDPLYEGDCVPMRPWQTMLFPTCNLFHEMDMSSVHSSYRMEMRQERRRRGDRRGGGEDGKAKRVDRIAKRFYKLNSGGYNDVFSFNLDPPLIESVVCKTLEFGSAYSDRNYDRVRRDALISERATKSPFVVDIYGHCGLSQFAPLGTEGTMIDQIDENLSSDEKLSFARHAAAGLAAAHDLDGDGESSITQGDLKADQYLLVDGRFKLGDFNRGRFLRRNKKTGKACTYTIGNNDSKYRSPEEYRYDGETAKIDVWALGSIIYQILTDQHVWKGYSEKEAQKKISKNNAPPIDDEWKESNDPVTKLLMHVMYEMCFVPEVDKRASAPEVSNYLNREAEKILEEAERKKGARAASEEGGANDDDALKG